VTHHILSVRYAGNYHMHCNAKKKQIFLHLKFILRTETFAYFSFCITVAVGGWLLLYFSFQVPTDVIVSLRSGIKEAMDFLVVCAVELSCWECPYCLSLTLRLACTSVCTRTLRNWAIHCAGMSHHISAFMLFNCMKICWLHLCIFCVLTHEQWGKRIILYHFSYGRSLIPMPTK
jgi:hypothetical protein